jgi:hypothetical protein
LMAFRRGMNAVLQSCGNRAWKPERRPAAGFSVGLKMVGEVLRRPTSPVD